MQRFLMLKQVVHIVITYFKGLREKQEFHQIFWSEKPTEQNLLRDTDIDMIIFKYILMQMDD